MNTPLLIIAVVLAAVAVALLVVLLLRKSDAASGERVRTEVDRVLDAVRHEFHVARGETAAAARQSREEITAGMRADADSLQQRLGENAQQQIAQLQLIATALRETGERGEARIGELRATVDEGLKRMAEAERTAEAQSRAELQTAIKDFREVLGARINEAAASQRERLAAFAQQLGELTTRSEAGIAQMRATLEAKLTQLQADNTAKLESIRKTVDEKLHETLEKRLGESFRLVSTQLEQVHTGLGEMKSLAVGVGDLQKTLSNVKARGTWGEVQLGNLLEQTLTTNQFARNYAPREDSSDRVEFAIRLPGREADGTPVWLPVDSKFPQEEYQRLVEAQERGDAAAVAAAGAAMEQGIRKEARKISEKYLNPPVTTDFAILFLPTESLFAEVLRRPGLSEALQREHRVVVSGPTTLTALLTSLQMGFRTLAIEKRSSEVWKVLGAVKAEFGKFGQALEKVQKKLTEASGAIDSAQVRSRAVERKLSPVDALPGADADALAAIDNDAGEASEEDEPQEKA